MRTSSVRSNKRIAYLSVCILRVLSRLSLALLEHGCHVLLLSRHGIGSGRCLGLGILFELFLEIAASLPSLAPAALLLSFGLLLVRLSPLLPQLLAAGNGVQQLLMIFRLALFAPVVVGNLVFVRAHAYADIVLPHEARLARDPRLARVFVLLGGAADAADDFFGVLRLLFFLLGLLVLLGLSTFRRGRLQLVKGLCVLALGGSDGASRFGFSCCGGFC